MAPFFPWYQYIGLVVRSRGHEPWRISAVAFGNGVSVRTEVNGRKLAATLGCYEDYCGNAIAELNDVVRLVVRIYCAYHACKLGSLPPFSE